MTKALSPERFRQRGAGNSFARKEFNPLAGEHPSPGSRFRHSDNRAIVAAVLDDIERELFRDHAGALLALPVIGEAQIRRWVMAAFETLTADAIAATLRDLDAIAELDHVETRAELEG
jgi:hypothetical protein